MKPQSNTSSVLASLVLSLLFALLAPAIHAAEKPKEAVKPYPLNVCIVTDNDLGSMGDERTFVYEGQEIKICCKPCEKKFLKDPARYLKKLAPAPAEKSSAPEAHTTKS
ncbi:hypothetical protein ESB00_00505 [Oleiharenicola lentus]|uniref:TRASH domain-containing protein n=1 Tax=Oleiharenicola lentus TaxID=2508720 RepID=A0A4Q1C6C5_9BACT|nr:hypothetical protein [Oleiharenicola lentus]RXK54413.1 hypothetical protein ESB00_00505 [Oleiharenicola lentus]